MLLYIVKSAACLAALYFFYRLFLERENMHLFKRWYLLLSLLLAFGIPLVSFTYTVPAAMPSEDAMMATPLVSGTGQAPEQLYNFVPVLWGIYGLGTLVFGFLFIKNLLLMLFKIKQNIKIKARHSTRVLVRESVIPHTFFSYIFLNKQKFETQQIPREVLLHEEAHARQKHSLDIICIEMLQVLFWFNPMIYMIKRAIKLNHEFLADRAVINGNVRISAYQQMLLAFSSNAKHHQLANAINYSLIKKRFTVMKKQTSKRTIGLRSLLLLPLVAVLLLSFSNKVAVTEENNTADRPDNEIQIVHPQQEQKHDEHIEIFISSEGDILVNNRATSMRNLESKIKKLKSEFSARSRQRLTASIYTESSADMKMVEKVVRLLNKHGVTRISLTGDMPPPPPPDSERARAIAYERKARARAVRDRERAALARELEAIEAEKAAEAEEIIEVEEVEEIEIEKAALAEEMAEIEAERIEEIEELAEMEAESVVEVREVAREREMERAIKARQAARMEREMKEAVEAERVAEAIEAVEIPPPSPVSPSHVIMAMAEKGAVFYYNGKKISSGKAIQLVKRRDNINVVAKKARSGKPVVYLSNKPIVIEE